MHLESHGIATGDPQRPFVGQITIGTKNRRETMKEFGAPSLEIAEQQADAWLNEYCARLGLGTAALLKPAAMRARWALLHDGMPAFPEPGKAYRAALERMGDGQQVDEDPRPRLVKPRRSTAYPARAKVLSAVASARAADIDVAGIRLWPDGSIAVFDARFGAVDHLQGTETTAYDEWKREESIEL